MWNMPNSYMRPDSSTCETCLSHIWDMIRTSCMSAWKTCGVTLCDVGCAFICVIHTLYMSSWTTCGDALCDAGCAFICVIRTYVIPTGGSRVTSHMWTNHGECHAYKWSWYLDMCDVNPCNTITYTWNGIYMVMISWYIWSWYLHLKNGRDILTLNGHDILIDCMCVAWLIHMWNMPRSYISKRDILIDLNISCFDATCIHATCAFICVTWLIHVWHNLWHDSFICATWLIHPWDMPHSHVWQESCLTYECVELAMTNRVQVGVES